MTAEDIRALVMAKRTAQGLKLCLRTPESETTLYPKDHATKTRWLACPAQGLYHPDQRGGAKHGHLTTGPFYD
jgi:hypothetical protein